MTRIIQISDCHLFSDRAQKAYAICPYTSLESILVLASQYAPDALLVTGDISADNSVQSYQHFLHLFNQYCQVPWRVIPGNHDNNVAFCKFLNDKLLTTSTCWQINGIRVFGLDTRFENTRGMIDLVQLKQTSTGIPSKKEGCNIVAMHHPPYALAGWMQRHELVNYTEFVDWLSEEPSIDMVLHGHLHADTEVNIAGVSVLGVPSTCWQFSLAESFSIAPLPAGMRIIDTNERGELSTTVVRACSPDINSKQ